MKKLGVDAAVLGAEIVPGDVAVDDGRIDAVGIGSGAGTGRIAVPGFCDLQVNGFAGIDFSTADGQELAAASAALARTGVTSFLATLITDALDHTIAQANAIAGAQPITSGARLHGIHLEGPAINPDRAGAHWSRHVIGPSTGLARRLLDEVTDLRMVTLAPELPGALDMTRALRDSGVTVSFGHTEATEEQALAGFEAGGAAVTHIFNAMRPIHHREPGIAAAVLMHPDAFVGLIADRLHVAPTIMKMVTDLAGPRLVLVTDASAGAGRGDGSYALGGESITVVDGVARRSDGVLAGSTLTMPEAIRSLLDLGVSFVDAVRAATLAPWSLLRRPEHASIAPGAVADIVITDFDLEIYSTLVAGTEVHER